MIEQKAQLLPLYICTGLHAGVRHTHTFKLNFIIHEILNILYSKKVFLQIFYSPVNNKA